MTKPRVVILGSGPSGLGAAYKLVRDGKADVTLLEQSKAVGGNAGSFGLAGLVCDYGSHRLHPSTPPDVLADVKSMLGDDLLVRPRHGRIRLMGRWIHFPLKPLDLLLHAHPRFKMGVAADALGRIARSRDAGNGGPETFATVLRAGLGGTICDQFYFPYAWKMWGQGPETLSAIQAKKRVSAGSLGRMFKRILGGARGEKGMKGFFYYPRQGYGQISQAYREAAERGGARIELEARVRKVARARDGALEIVYERGGTRTLHADHVWSTIPVTAFVRMLEPAAPPEVIEAARRVRFRSMVLAYLVLPVAQFTEFDAHYFPEREVPFTRLSEPKNYSVRGEPKGVTVLCAEIPCSMEDDVWKMSPEDLGRRVAAGLEALGLPLPAPPVEVILKKLETAYPIYDLDAEERFGVLDRHLLTLPRILAFGRLGLFAHDNTHHALHMGYAAAGCLRADGTFDDASWGEHRKAFQAHVVED